MDRGRGLAEKGRPLRGPAAFLRRSAHGGLLIAPITPGLDADGWRSGDNFMGAPLDFDGYASKAAEILDRHDKGQLETIRQNGVRHARSKTWGLRAAELLAHLEQRGLPRNVSPEPVDQDDDAR